MIDWYPGEKIDLEDFCDRRRKLKDLEKNSISQNKKS